MYLEVAPNLPGHDRTYHYRLPDDWPSDRAVSTGLLVDVPFGEQRLQGIVVSLSDDEADLPPDLPDLKPIHDVVDPLPVLTPAQLDLAYWISHTYQTPLPACLTLMLPPGLSKRGDARYTLLDSDAQPNSPAQAAVLAQLASGPVRRRQLEARLRKDFPNWNDAIGQLLRRGVIQREAMLDAPDVNIKTVRSVRLALPLSELPTARMLLETGKMRDRLLQLLLTVWPAQLPKAEALRLLPKVSENAVTTLVKEGWIIEHPDGRLALAHNFAATALEAQQSERRSRKTAVLDFLARHHDSAVEVSWVYAETGATSADLRELAEREWVILDSHEVYRDSLRDLEFVPTAPPPLTPEQVAVWEPVQAAIDQPPATFLLHGVTGSGKTEVYLRAVAETLAHGRQAIVLVPEIAMTPQTVERFSARFPGRVAIWHSGLSDGERYDTWRRARAGFVDVVVGTRSALFLPLPRLGLIVLDEEHDDSYKQSVSEDFDARPFYHARETAVEYARRIEGVCLLGSATPSLEAFSRAQHGEYQLLSLPVRIMMHYRRLHAQETRWRTPTLYRTTSDTTPDARYLPMPDVRVVDMRQELRAGNRSIFSRALSQALEDVLSSGAQAILFLNRRGSATYVFCRDCGYTLACERCDTPLTFHAEGQMLRCHRCGHRQRPPERCPQCMSRRIRYFGLGTERVEHELQAAFPQVRPLRWDQDTARDPATHAILLRHFANHQADVLIGTQMVAKGLDLPLVTLVGVINADISLALPDFRAAERTFQLLAQVAGRAGRGLRGGQVIVQSYMPEHYAIEAASQHNYSMFYAEEMRYRREQGLPPYSRLVQLVYRHTNPVKAEGEARRVFAQVREAVQAEEASSTLISGPAPAFFYKIADFYRWQMVLRGPNPATLLPHLSLPPGWRVELDPLSLL